MTTAATGVKKLKKLRRGPKTEQPVDVAYPELERMLAGYNEAKDAATVAAMRSFDLAERIITFMRDKGIDKYTRGAYTADVRQAHPEVLDWEGIQGVLPDSIWKQILGEPQPVKQKLEALIELGIIDTEMAAAIAKFITVKDNKPYVDLKRNIK